ncbi:MAG: hypothetical protein LBG93_06805 [Treponema sp.]|jgi:hypothetical protein|nr:hypothetical protein [Treponema sp.]
MFENFSNLIFIAIALAIFIGRTVARARKEREEAADEKKAAPPPPPQPRVQSLHFEEKERDEGRKAPAAAKLAKPPAKKPAPKVVQQPTRREIPPAITAEQLFPARAVAPVAAVRQQDDFSFNLGNITPLQQAVVMSEILGPPKGLREQ